jgi:hypothetical protein
MGAIALGRNGLLDGDIHTRSFHLLCDRWLSVMVLEPGHMALGKRGLRGDE